MNSIATKGNAPAAGHTTRAVHAMTVVLAMGFLSASFQLAPRAAQPVQARPDRCALEAVSEKRAIALCTKTLRRAAGVYSPYGEAAGRTPTQQPAHSAAVRLCLSQPEPSTFTGRTLAFSRRG